MDNEHLAVLIQQGRTDLYTELWAQTQKFFALKSNRFYYANQGLCDRYGVELDDLIQSCFFALCGAVKAYKPNAEYKLLTYAGYQVKNAFRDLLGKDILNKCSSLDEPLSEESEITKEDIIPDEAAERAFENATDGLFNEQLHAAVERAINTLNEPEQRIIHARFYDGLTYEAAAEALNTTKDSARSLEAKAIHNLRKPSSRKFLQPFYDEVLTTHAWRNTGFNSFRFSGASSVEKALEAAERAVNER